MLDFFLISIICGITILGFYKIYSSINKLKTRKIFIQLYLSNFHEFCVERSQEFFDNEKYVWLTQNVSKIQRELGFNGVVYNYHPPYANYIYPEYQLLVNTLPQIRVGQAYNQDIASCEDALLRQMGSLQEMKENYLKYIKNPFVWLRVGVNLIITLPLRMAYWFGVLNYKVLEKFTNNILVKILSFMIAIVGLLSSVITIVMGWKDFVSLIKEFVVR